MDIDHHQHDDMDDDGNDFATILDHLVHPPASHRRDPRTVRLSAATAALIETVHERRQQGGDGCTNTVLLGGW